RTGSRWLRSTWPPCWRGPARWANEAQARTGDEGGSRRVEADRDDGPAVRRSRLRSGGGRPVLDGGGASSAVAGSLGGLGDRPLVAVLGASRTPPIRGRGVRGVL